MNSRPFDTDAGLNDRDAFSAAERCREEILSEAGRSRTAHNVDLADTPALIRSLESISGSFHGWELFSELKTEITRIINRLARLEQETLNVAVIGEFSAGKSTLINALLGGEPFLPMKISETTAVVSKLLYAPYPEVIIHYRNGTTEKSSLEDYKTLVDETQISAVRKDVAFVSVYFDYKPLKKITIYDTPGLNSKIIEHERTTLHYLNSVEVVFWLFKATKPMCGTEMRYIEAIRSRGCRVYGIINGIDRIRGFEREPERWHEELDRVVKAVQEGCKDVTEDIIPISAKLGMDGMLRRDNQVLQRSNIGAVQQVIEQELTEKAGKLKQDHLQHMVGLFSGLAGATAKYLDQEAKDGFAALEDLLSFMDLKQQEYSVMRYQTTKSNAAARRKPPWELP